MALHLPLRRLLLVSRTQTLPPQTLRARSLAQTRGSCAGGDVPACPPCEPAAQPACRARPSPVRRALRVVCCPPPRGSRPPCPPRDPSCPLTCSNVIDQGRTISTRTRKDNEEWPATEPRCGGETDRVARRLALAKSSRRQEYEREVARREAAARARPAGPPAAAEYRLGVERECARATDGCLYTVPHAPCGPGRAPPLPQCVELAPDDNCRIRGEARLDPCAHRPRIMIEIDRREHGATATPPPESSAVTDAAPSLSSDRRGITGGCAFGTKKNAPVKSSTSQCSNVRSVATDGLTSRIIKTLNFGGGAGSGGGGADCPRNACGGECKSGGARHAGDDSWCSAPPPPAPAPARCRRPGIADRLRARAAPPGTAEQSCARKLHTSAATAAGGLKETLRKRAELREAGLGRVVVQANEDKSQRTDSPFGRLDLPVPPGTERVRVRVSLDKARRKPRGGCATRPASQPSTGCVGGTVSNSLPYASPAQESIRPDSCRRLAATKDKCDSWLSIKNIQKKLTGSRRGEEAAAAPRPPLTPPRTASSLPHEVCPPPSAASPVSRDACPPPRAASTLPRNACPPHRVACPPPRDASLLPCGTCPPPRDARPASSPRPPATSRVDARESERGQGQKKCISTVISSSDAVV